MQLAKLEKEAISNNRNTERNSQDIENIFIILKELIAKDAKPVSRKRIGFRRRDEQD